MISVIVPIFNAESSLPRCLDSIVSQSFKDLEIILVDDGSTDGSRCICDAYSAQDSRIKVIHKQNGGVSEARNVGLRAAKGEFVQFVDNDDIIHPQMIEILCNLINSGDYDFAMCYGEKIFNIDEITDRIQRPVPISPAVEISSDYCLRNLYTAEKVLRVQYHWIWNKLYKRELIHNICFVNNSIEDVVFNNCVYQRTGMAIMTSNHLYYWIQRSKSLLHSGNYEREGKELNSYMQCLLDIPIENSLYRSYCLRRLFRTMFSAQYWSRNTTSHDIEKSLSKKIYKQRIKEFIHNSHIPLSEKVVLPLFFYFPFLYSLFISIAEKKHNKGSSFISGRF